MEVRKRSRTQTMARILHAVGEVISERGVNRVGINAVAEKAGVNKVLIYRYFGGWDGLMGHFLSNGNVFTNYNNQFLEHNAEADQKTRNQTRAAYLIGLLRELKERTPAQEMLKWEISNPGLGLTPELSHLRNVSFQKVLDKFFTSENEDLNALTAILISGITLMLLVSPSHPQFMNLDLQSEEGWQQIEFAIQHLFKS